MGLMTNGWLAYLKTGVQIETRILAARGSGGEPSPSPVLDQLNWVLRSVVRRSGDTTLAGLLILYGGELETCGLTPSETAIHQMQAIYKPYRALRAWLLAAQEAVQKAGRVSQTVYRAWETLCAEYPDFFIRLPSASPGAHFAMWYLLGLPTRAFATAEEEYARSITASHALSDWVTVSLPGIRRAVIDAVHHGVALLPGCAFAWSPAITDRALLRHVVFDAVEQVWTVSPQLQPYWEVYACQPGAGRDMAQHLFLLTCAANGLDDYRHSHCIAMLDAATEGAKSDVGAEKIEYAAYRFPNWLLPEHLALQACLSKSQRFAQWSRVALLNEPENERLWEALCQEIEELNSRKIYPVQTDLQGFFTEFLQTVWELDPDLFKGLSDVQTHKLAVLYAYAQFPERAGLPETKPEEPDGEAACGTETYWRALETSGVRTAPRSALQPIGWESGRKISL